MNPKAQRLAIARALDWKPTDKEVRARKKWLEDGGGNYYINPPDYLHDLNAMHEAEKRLFKLANTNEEAYSHHLTCLTSGWSTYHATAAQRAEAFLRTIGAWRSKKS